MAVKYYGVKKGNKIGVFTSWNECKEQTVGFSGAEYKKFNTEEEANSFVYGETSSNPKGKKSDATPKLNKRNQIYFYVDGSYNESTNTVGYGLVAVKNNKVLFKDLGIYKDHKYNNSRNVFGEVMGSMRALEIALANDYNDIAIVYDYEGIEKWISGSWKAKTELTKEYKEFMNKNRRNINIQFVNVMAHTGVEFNEVADKLAKKAVGIL